MKAKGFGTPKVDKAIQGIHGRPATMDHGDRFLFDLLTIKEDILRFYEKLILYNIHFIYIYLLSICV